VESKLGPLGTSAINRSTVPAPGNCEDGEFCGMKIGRENRNTRRKLTPAPLRSLKIPHELTRARTRAAAVGRQRLTAWAMARPKNTIYLHSNIGIADRWNYTTSSTRETTEEGVLRLPCSTQSEILAAFGQVDVDTAKRKHVSSCNLLILNYEYNSSVSADTW
jgi:hypothetical protein